MPGGTSRFGPRIDVRPLFPRERAAMLELLGSLSPPQWQAEAVPGWSVQDVVAHVLHDQLRRLSSARDHHDVPLPPGVTLAERIDAANEQFVAVARQLSPPLLVDLLGHLGPQLDAVWAGLDLDARAGFDVSWAGTGAPAWLDVAREYTEYWVHQQQVRDAVGRPGFATPDVLRPVLETFARALPATLHGIDRAPGTTATLQVTGPAGGAWTVVRGADGWTLHERADMTAHTTVTLDQDSFWRLATRMIGVDEARERADPHGDPEMARAMTSLLAIVR